MTTPDTADTEPSDARLLADFLAGRIDAARFDHRAHLHAAWLVLRAAPLPQAIDAYCDALERIARDAGVPQKYQRTRTEALLRLMAHAGATDPQRDWPAFVAANPALLADARGVLARHYSDDCLASPAARARFVPPDRAPLPA